MSEHTPTPWRIRNAPRGEDFFIAADMTDDHPYKGVSRDVEVMADGDYPRKRADAERIVACVNACAGMTTADLKSGIVQELIDACTALREWHKGEYQSNSDIDKRVDAVLAKVQKP